MPTAELNIHGADLFPLYALLASKTRCCVDNLETCVIHVQGPQLSRSIVPVLAGVVLLNLMFFFITSGAGSNSESRF